jgi:23S rRNA pseudouridine2605 synthase
MFSTKSFVGIAAQFPRRVFARERLYLLSSSIANGDTGNSTSQLLSTTKKTSNTKNKSLFRADRVLANRGWGSRAVCHDLLRQKRVFQQVNSEMKRILGPSEKISMDASLFVDGKIEVPRPPPLLRVFHKPKWVLSVMNDSKGRRHLGELDESLISKMHPVGRLDYDTSGLLLFSSEGALTQFLLHPSHQVQKEYLALVVGTVQEEELRERLKQGVQTSMGVFPADLVTSRSIPECEVRGLIDDILSNLPPEYDVADLEEKGHLFFKEAKELSEVQLIVKEGKHRMVRRILKNSGFPVIGLKRLRLGIVHLNDLAEGCMRELTQEEEEWAINLTKKKKKSLENISKT